MEGVGEKELTLAALCRRLGNMWSEDDLVTEWGDSSEKIEKMQPYIVGEALV